MLEHRFLFVKLTIVALLVALALPARAEWKTRYTSGGNNVGFVIATSQWGGPLRGAHQFPRGSGNIFNCERWNWGVHVARDCDGDGIAEDTSVVLSRGGNVTKANNSLESIDLIHSLAAAGEMMGEACNRIENNRVWVSTDADDLADWPPEFREGRTASGAPIVHGAETIVIRHGDCFTENGIGQSVEYQFYFMNFGESNNMVYARVFFRNMSEYVKWHDESDVRAKVANTPDGQVWLGMQQWTANAYQQWGERDEAWAIHFPTESFLTADHDGLESTFAGYPAMKINHRIRNAHLRDEVLKLTNTCRHGWNTEWGVGGISEVMEGGYEMPRAYRYGLGKNHPSAPFYPDPNPWTGGLLYGWPGIFEEGDPYYDTWIWGERNYRNQYDFWTEFHNVMPRDSFSIDEVIIFQWAKNAPFSWPNSQDLANIGTPDGGNAEVEDQLSPVHDWVQKAEIVYGGGFILPETPTPPPLTIIPGNKQVTITWSDVNINTPDSYYSFLQDNPALDPDGVYREFDFEGYRLYRSYVGPSDSHSELIYECSKSAGDIAFYFRDLIDDDDPLYRMKNGMRVWYALVPYDYNVDPATGVAFSLPEEGSGKAWNRPGGGLYTVIPRSEASEFREASYGGSTYVGSAPVSDAFVELSGDGSGKLTELPKWLVPPLEFSIEIVNNERLTQARTDYVECTGLAAAGMWCRFIGPVRELSLLDGSGNVMMSAPIDATTDTEIILMDAATTDGVRYGLHVNYENVVYDGRFPMMYYDFDYGSYTGAEITIPGVQCAAYPGLEPSMGAYYRTGVYEATVKSVAGGLSFDVQELVRGTTIPFGLYTDDDVWGFMAEGTYSGFFGEAADNVPRADRENLMFETIAADNTDIFGLYVNGTVFEISEITAMPSVGDKFTFTTTFGEWNDDQTVFTQYPEAPWLGDKWRIDINPMTLDPDSANLSKIMVVPNPYLASSFLDLSPDSRRIEFVNLPSRCTIRIFSLGGHLVNVLNHIGADRHGWGNYLDWDRLDAESNPKQLSGWDNHRGTEAWNMRNRFGQTVASGLYFFHVTDTRGETQTGRFYIIN